MKLSITQGKNSVIAELSSTPQYDSIAIAPGDSVVERNCGAY